MPTGIYLFPELEFGTSGIWNQLWSRKSRQHTNLDTKPDLNDQLLYSIVTCYMLQWTKLDQS